MSQDAKSGAGLSSPTESRHGEFFEILSLREEVKRLRKLVEAADEFHRVTFLDWSHRPEWQRLGGVLNDVAPRDFDRVTGDRVPESESAEAL